MKKIIKLLVIVLGIMTSWGMYAQENTHTQSYTESFDSIYVGLNQSLANTGYIYDRVFPFAKK